MEWDYVEGKWQQLRGHVREQWGKLTDDDIEIIAGKRDQLIGLLQQRYSRTREQVEHEVHEFEKRLANAHS